MSQQFKLIMGGPDFTLYPKIQLPFQVLDNSATLDTLRPEDFMVFENGVRMMPVEIECGDLQGAQKIHFFFLMDVSLSMVFKDGTTIEDVGEDGEDSTKWRRAKSVFIESFQKLRPQDEGALASFAADFLLEQDFTTNKNRLSEAAYGMFLRQGTAIYSAIANAVSIFSGRDGKRVIILLTDGVDNRSRHTREQAINLAWQAGIPVYTIGLGLYLDPNDPWRKDQDTLRRIANGTGGKAYFTPTSDDLSRIFSDILQAIYSVNCVMRYTTPDTCEDGSSRNVTVQANIHGVPLQHSFSYTLPDLRSRLQLSVSAPPVLRARDEYTMPVMVDGEVRGGEPMSFRVRLDYPPEHMSFVGLETGPGVISAGDIRVSEPQAGMLLFEATQTMPASGILYGSPTELFTLRFLMLDHDSVAPCGVNLTVDFAEQTCVMVPTAARTDFIIHGCPASVTLGFDTTLAVVSGGTLRLPVMLTPGVDFRQTLDFGVTVEYDATLMEYSRIETKGTMSSQLSLLVSERPGALDISTTSPGVPSDSGDVLFYLYFDAIDTKSALPVGVALSNVTVAQSATGVIGYNCEPDVSLYGNRVYIDGICDPLLRLRPRPALEQNSPNPVTAATAQTRIPYRISGSAPMRLEIVDQFGRVVTVLEEGVKEAGSYTATWIPGDAPSGVYLCVLREGEVIRTRSIVYTR